MTPEQVHARNREVILTVLDEHDNPIGLTVAQIQARMYCDHEFTMTCDSIRNHLNSLRSMGWAERGEAEITNAAVWRLSDQGRKALHSRERTSPR